MDVDPRELTAGYAYPKGKGVAMVTGVLRDGERGLEVWRCSSLPSHRPHIIPTLAVQCAEAELERRLQGAQEVLWALHCRPCDIFWDLAWLSRDRRSEAARDDIGHWLLRGQCPRCEVPAGRVKLIVLERQEASVR